MKTVKMIAAVIVIGVIGFVPMSGSAADESVTMSFWSRDSNRAMVETLINAWNETHPNKIELTSIPVNDFFTKFGTAVTAGVGPDITAVDLIYVPQFADAGQFTDLTDFVQAMPDLDKLSPSHVRLGIYNERNYALPFNAEGSVLMYNKKLFKQAGLDPENPPVTWEEIYQAAQKITAIGDDIYGFYFSGNCAGCNAFTWLPYVWASGGDVLTPDNVEPTIAGDPMVKAALEFYRKMWEEGLIPEGAKVDNGSEFFNAFCTDKIGMIGTGAFGISILKNEYPEIEFGVTFLPGQNDGKSSFAGGDSVAIPTGSKYVKEAFEFIQWMYSDETQLELYAKNNHLPVRLDMAKNKYFDADPRLETAANAMGMSKTANDTIADKRNNTTPLMSCKSFLLINLIKKGSLILSSSLKYSRTKNTSRTATREMSAG
jgi:multiple sugar transport system substrate-binding protein